eukprot:536792-Prorocentrum_minimum.AAC.1
MTRVSPYLVRSFVLVGIRFIFIRTLLLCGCLARGTKPVPFGDLIEGWFKAVYVACPVFTTVAQEHFRGVVPTLARVACHVFVLALADIYGRFDHPLRISLSFGLHLYRPLASFV